MKLRQAATNRSQRGWGEPLFMHGTASDLSWVGSAMGDREFPEDHVSPAYRCTKPVTDGLLALVVVLQIKFDGFANLYMVSDAETLAIYK